MIFYESPHRILKTLEELAVVLGEERQASVSRELTKLFEENVRGTLVEIKNHFETHTLKGEFVLCVAGMERKGKKKGDGNDRAEE
jgi:16S rRNA (cytidine1402-2'-O)-methyltransferase